MYQQKKQYSLIIRLILRNLTPGEKKVYRGMVEHSNALHETIITNKQLAEALGYSIEAVSTCIDNFVELRLIERRKSKTLHQIMCWHIKTE